MATASNSTPASQRIHVRRMDFQFTQAIPEYWADDNAVLTALMAALSASFPPGERFFIDSVRHFADRITDADLKERIRGFIGQEANHTKEHLAFNKFLDDRGLPVGKIQQQVEEIVKMMRKRDTPERNLARTVALEHMTAFLASSVLENPEVLERMHPTVAAFWAWHAIEEIEHRSVAFDVYKECVDDEWMRVRAMAVVTVLFSMVNAIRTVVILRQTGNLTNLPAWARGFDTLFGKTGILRKGIPLYVAYFRRNFHPDQHDNAETVERAKHKYLQPTYERSTR